MTLRGADDQGNAVYLTTTTLADGSYKSTNLRPATYAIAQSQPADYLDGVETTRSQAGSADAEVVLTIPPAHRTELVLSPHGDDGGMVVKNRLKNKFYHLGPQEAFLLARLDGKHTVADLCTGFEQRFGEPLTGEDVDEFVKTARAQGFLQIPEAPADTPPSPDQTKADQDAAPDASDADAMSPVRRFRKATKDLLFLRVKLIDPDRLLNWLVPKVWFLWTPAFVILSLGAIAWAGVLLTCNWREYTGYFPAALRWEILVLGYVVLIGVTTLHEFAHGLTCKRHGGEVHEMGFYLMFFIPCLYCNVSDAWLIREKSKRLWVTFAGAYCDLCLWALAVFIWCLALPQSLPYHLAWVVVSVCGARFFFNFFPLFKLDGYYLLSDWLEIPNLRQRALDRFAAYVRWLLWGAKYPGREPRGMILLVFGAACWGFSVFYLVLFLVGFLKFYFATVGALAFGVVALLGWLVLPRMFVGFSKGEATKMFWKRRKRLGIWIGLGAGVVAILVFVPMPDRAGGTFELCPVTQAELRAREAGFLQEVAVDQGDPVAAGALVARLEIPDLATRRAKQGAAIKEAQAKLRLQEVELRGAQEALTRARKLFDQRALSAQGYAEAEQLDQVSQAKVKATRAELERLEEEARYLEGLQDRVLVHSPVAGVIDTPRMREKIGQYCQKGDLICTVKDPSAFTVEISMAEQDAAPIRPGQLVELKVRSLPFETFQARVTRIAPSAVPPGTDGSTPVGQGNTPPAPARRPTGAQQTVIVYCELTSPAADLRPGMTGYARVECGSYSLGSYLFHRSYRYLRTEFWW